jgi:hypothetical protein
VRLMPDWLHKIRNSRFVIRLTHWEYWPFGIIQFPLFLYYPWLSLRARSLTFFSGSNPGIPMGGMFGESKFEVLQKLPESIVPKTILIRQPASIETILSTLEQRGLTFPLIFKPDLGERGFMVKRINGINDIQRYTDQLKYDFLVQEFVDLPMEFGIFYQRRPTEPTGKVTSVVLKEMLSVVGNGSSTLKELILENGRAKLQWETLRVTYKDELNLVIPSGERREIVSIGNHCLGTKFINANYLISEELTASFDCISKQIEGFYFGRFDLRCKDLEDLKRGKVMVMELNGSGAEPSHIYDPAFSLWIAIRTLIEHWKTIFEIAMQNKMMGYQFISLKDAIDYYQNFKKKVK